MGRAVGVFNGNWRTGAYRRFDEIPVAPAPVERTPAQEIERLNERIAAEEAFIEKYGANYKSKADEARARLDYYKLQREEWRVAIYAADQEAATAAARELRRDLEWLSDQDGTDNSVSGQMREHRP